jgi:hypothetical protein
MFIVWLDHQKLFRPIEEKDKTDCVDFFETECLWNNQNVIYRGKLLLMLDWVNAGLMYISDIWQQNDIIPFNEIVRKVGHSPSRLFEYNAIRTAVRARASRLGQGTCPTTIPQVTEGMSPRSIRLRLAMASACEPCSVGFWHRKYDTKIDKQHWMLAKECTKEIRLQLLHWKILHNIYPTGILLSKMGIRNCNKCPFCDEPDYLEHFFWHCKKVSPAWLRCTDYIQAKTGLVVTLTAKEALFGYYADVVSRDKILIINHLILITKMYISKYKYGTESNLEILLHQQTLLRKL